MTSNNAFAALWEFVVPNKLNMTSYFPEARKLNGSDDDMCSNVAGRSGSGSGDLFELSDQSNKTDPVKTEVFLLLLFIL